MKIPKVEINKPGIAQRIMNNILWGNSPYNPNNIDIAADDEVWIKSVPQPEDVKEGEAY
jgi:hypothetical protein